jgi:hypothetical protein
VARNKTRWLVVYIDPKTGKERLGTGADAGSFAEYVSVENVIKFQLKHLAYPAGQYHIYHWPRGYDCAKTFVTAYKRAQNDG